MSTEFGDNDDLTIVYDLTNQKSDADFGAKPLPPGKYHAVVEAVKRDTLGDKPVLKLSFRIKHGPVANKHHHESIFLGEKSEDRQKFIANRLGLFKDQLGRPNAAARWALAVGKHVVIEIQENKYKDKHGQEQTGSRLTYGGIWPVTHPEVRDVPKDIQSLAEEGIVLPEGEPPAPSATNGHTTPSTGPAAAPAATEEYGDV